MQFRKVLLILCLATLAVSLAAGCSKKENKVPVFTRTSTSGECGVAPMDVQFVAIASGGDQLPDPTGANSYLDIAWDFADGGTGTGSVIAHTFTEPGMYEVTVSVTDDDGDSSDSIIPIQVRADSLVVTTVADTSVVASLTYFDTPTPRAANGTGTGPIKAGLVINEVVAFNDSLLLDLNGLSGSFMEVLNTTTETIELQNYSLTLDPFIPDMSVFGDGCHIEPGEFQIIWIDGRNLNGVDPHTDFTLLGDYDGEPEDWPGTTLYLLAPDNSPIDIVVLRNAQTNVSFGRFPDGGIGGTVHFNLWLDTCGFDPLSADYSRFEFTWHINDSFGSTYSGRDPMHTFSTLDVGSNVISVQAFDRNNSVHRVATVTVDVTAP